MFSFNKLRTKWRREKSRIQRSKGFDFAAGMLLRGRSTLEVDSMKDLVYYDDFDRGINDAINEAIKNGWVVDDRIQLKGDK